MKRIVLLLSLLAAAALSGCSDKEKGPERLTTLAGRTYSSRWATPIMYCEYRFIDDTRVIETYYKDSGETIQSQTECTYELLEYPHFKIYYKDTPGSLGGTFENDGYDSLTFGGMLRYKLVAE